MSDKDEKQHFREIVKIKNAELWEVTNDQCSLKDKGELELLFSKDIDISLLRLNDLAWNLSNRLQVVIANNFSPDWKIYAFCAPNSNIHFIKISGLDFKSDSHPELLNLDTFLRYKIKVKQSLDLIPGFSQLLKQEPSCVIPLSKNSYHDAYPDLPNYRQIREVNEIFWSDDQTYNMVDILQSELNKIYPQTNQLTKSQGTGQWAQLWGGDQDSLDLEKFFLTLSISQKPDQTPSGLGQKVEGQQNLGQGLQPGLQQGSFGQGFQPGLQQGNLGQGFQPGLEQGNLGQGFQSGLQQGNLGQGIDQNYSLFFEVIRYKNAELWEATLDHYTFKYKGDIVLLYSKKLDTVLLKIHDHTFVVDKSLQVIPLRNIELGFVYFAICSPGGFDLIKVHSAGDEYNIHPCAISNLWIVFRERATTKICDQYKDKFALFQEATPSGSETETEKYDLSKDYDRHTDNYWSYCSVKYVLGPQRQSFPVKPISQFELDNAKAKTDNLSKYYEGSGIWQHLWNDDIGSEYLENYFANLHSHKELEQLPSGQQGPSQQSLGKGSEQQGQDKGWHTVEGHEQGGDTRTMGNVPQKGGDLKEISAP